MDAFILLGAGPVHTLARPPGIAVSTCTSRGRTDGAERATWQKPEVSYNAYGGPIQAYLVRLYFTDSALCSEGCAAVVIQGQLYVLGGNDHNEPLNTIERYDPDSDEWIDLSPMLERRHGLSAVALHTARQIIAIGGWNGTQLLSSTEIYDIESDTWASSASMHNARMYHAATVLA